MPVPCENVVPLDPQLYDSVMNGTQHEQRQALNAIGRLLSTSNVGIMQGIIDAKGLLARLVELLREKIEEHLTESVILVIGNLTAAFPEQTQAVIDAGALPELVNLIKPYLGFGIQNLVVWAIGNIAVDSDALRNMVFDAGAIKPILDLFDNEEAPRFVLNEAVWCLSNIIRSASREQNMYIIEQGGVSVLLKQAEINTKAEAEQARLAMESLETLQKLMNSEIDDQLIQKLDFHSLANVIETAKSNFNKPTNSNNAEDDDEDE